MLVGQILATTVGPLLLPPRQAVGKTKVPRVTRGVTHAQWMSSTAPFPIEPSLLDVN